MLIQYWQLLMEELGHPANGFVSYVLQRTSYMYKAH